MYIYLRDLTDNLRRHIQIQTYNINPSLAICAIEMLPSDYAPGKTQLDSNTLYICDYRQFMRLDYTQELPTMVCVVESGRNADSVLFMRHRVIAVYGMNLVDTLVTLTNTVYESASKTSYITELTQQLMGCNTIRELLRTGALLLQNPMVLTDNTQKIIAATPMDQVTNPSYRYIINSEYLPVGHPAQEGKNQDHDYMEPQVYGDGDMGENLPPVVCCTLQIAGRRMGYLHALGYNHEFTIEDRHLIQLVANLLALELLRHPRSERYVKEEVVVSFLRSILDNTAGNAERIMTRQRDEGISLNQFLYVMAIIPKTTDFSAHISFFELTQQIPQILPGAVCFTYQDSVLTLLNEKNEVTDFSAFLERLMPLLQQYKLMAGISNPFSAIHQLRDYAFQARKALDLGALMGEEENIYLFSDYILPYISEICLKTTNIEMLCPPELVRLIMYSRDNGDELLETLKVYLQCGRSKTETSKKMYVHMNTVKYRISQIQKITGCDFSNDKTALKFILAIGLFDYKGKLAAAKDIEPPPKSE